MALRGARGREGRALALYEQLTRASDRIGAELQPALGGAGLTSGQLWVLHTIVEDGPTSLRELGARLFRSGPNMTIVVDNLERAALVRRRRSAADRRVVLVESTDEGRRRLHLAFPTYASVITRFMEALSAGEQTQLAALCEKLRAEPVARRRPSRPALATR